MRAEDSAAIEAHAAAITLKTAAHREFNDAKSQFDEAAGCFNRAERALTHGGVTDANLDARLNKNLSEAKQAHAAACERLDIARSDLEHAKRMASKFATESIETTNLHNAKKESEHD